MPPQLRLLEKEELFGAGNRRRFPCRECAVPKRQGAGSLSEGSPWMPRGGSYPEQAGADGRIYVPWPADDRRAGWEGVREALWLQDGGSIR